MSFMPAMSFWLHKGAPLLVATAVLSSAVYASLSVPHYGPVPAGEIKRTAPRAVRAKYCRGIGLVDMGSRVDGPAYYFSKSDGKIIGYCGGYCMGDPANHCASQCPPRRWNCGNPGAFDSTRRRD